MNRHRCLLVAVVAAGLLTSCGGGSGSNNSGGAHGSETSTVNPSPYTSPEHVAPKTRLSVPSLYDTSHGWESDLPGERLTLPHSRAVAVFREGLHDGTFTVLDVTSGQTLWKTEVEGPGMMSALSITMKGKDYLVASASGSKGADIVSKGREVTTIDIFPARATGYDVKPAHHLELNGEGAVSNGGGGLLVELDDDVIMTVNPATGATKRYDLRKMEPPADECKLCLGATEAVAVTPRGPLLTKDNHLPGGHFWVQGAWSGGALTTTKSVFIAPVKDSLVAQWYDKGAGNDTWAVLDPSTGEVRAEVDCAPNRGRGDDEGATLSANGRYLIRSHTAFDLEKGTGRCFEETDRDKPVHLTGVTDDGIAFGVVALTAAQTRTGPRVTIDLATGQVKASDYVIAPSDDYSGYGLFWDDSDSTDTMVAYPHST